MNVLRECMTEAHQAWRTTEYPVVVIGTTSEVGQVPMGVLSCFKHEIAFEVGSVSGPCVGNCALY